MCCRLEVRLYVLQVWIQKYDEEMGAAEATYQDELAQTNQVSLLFSRSKRFNHNATAALRFPGASR